MRPDSLRKPAVEDPGPVRLADAIDPPEDPRPEVKPGRTLPAGIEPMLGIDDLAALLSCSRRLVERMRSAGKVPKPDIKIGKMPRWKPETIRRWIEGGSRL
jgi:predicted DNA-binding transcriptional regulator AlpA